MSEKFMNGESVSIELSDSDLDTVSGGTAAPHGIAAVAGGTFSAHSSGGIFSLTDGFVNTSSSSTKHGTKSSSSGGSLSISVS